MHFSEITRCIFPKKAMEVVWKTEVVLEFAAKKRLKKQKFPMLRNPKHFLGSAGKRTLTPTKLPPFDVYSYRLTIQADKIQLKAAKLLWYQCTQWHIV